VKIELQHMMEAVTVAAGDEHNSIFHAHYLILEDADFLQNIRTRVYTEAMSSEQAWTVSVDELLQRYSRLESPYQRERGRDLEDLHRQVLAMLGEGQSGSFEPAYESVVIAADLTPSDVALMEGSRVVGMCTAYGSPTSHSSILARALGIPAVVGLGPEILSVKEGSMVAVDGEAGSVWIDPEHVEALFAKREKWLQTRRGPAVIFHEKIATADGRRVRICANISSVNEARRAVELGADGVGVLRTEFLFMRRIHAPTEQEQLETYASIAEIMGERPLVIRTLDAGGDKPLPYIPSRCEANSFLGVRGLRLSLEHPELFETQLRAILRAGTGKDVSILLPMVSSKDEVRQAREHLEQARRDLIRDHLPFSRDVKLGIMIEVPAAALIAGHLAKEVDFMSIGTNDLSQYVLSADRGSKQLSSLCDPLHPAVLRLISETTRACRGSGIWAGVCGEVASDRCALPLLLGLGIDELSMNPFAVPGIKKEVSELDSVKTSSIAAEALKLSTGREVRLYVAETLGVPCEETGSG
jgi:phosphocarrier protein FPr